MSDDDYSDDEARALAISWFGPGAEVKAVGDVFSVSRPSDAPGADPAAVVVIGTGRSRRAALESARTNAEPARPSRFVAG